MESYPSLERSLDAGRVPRQDTAGMDDQPGSRWLLPLYYIRRKDFCVRQERLIVIFNNNFIGVAFV